MSKKVIFVGPSGAGKTTLRKIFFEGENSAKLLEYALEPTYGEESLILRLPGLNEEIGIFDLAGQENQRWLETEENVIFLESKILLVVIDITLGLNYILEFVNKILEIRRTLTPSSMIYVLIHKIDLAKEKKLREIKSSINNEFQSKNQLKFMFTSLKKKFFTQTFSYFIEIMKTCLEDEITDEGLEFNVIDESIKIIYLIDKEVSMTKTLLRERLNRPEKLVNYLIENLINKGHIQIENIGENKLLSLTDLGKNYFKNVLKTFSADSYIDSVGNSILSEMSYEEKIPSIIGALIADKDGRSLLKLEIFENALEKYLQYNHINDPSIVPVDLDLIPMFVSALEKFSLELNIQDLTGFGLKGSNLKMHILSYEDITVILFMNPNINIKPVENQISNYFFNLYEENKTDFDNALKTGQIDCLFSLIDKGREWLDEFNKSYEKMIINLEIIDIEHAKSLYSKIDELYSKVNSQFAITLEKIKKLKINLMKAILEKDYEELKKLAKFTLELSSNYIT